MAVSFGTVQLELDSLDVVIDNILKGSDSIAVTLQPFKLMNKDKDI